MKIYITVKLVIFFYSAKPIYLLKPNNNTGKIMISDIQVYTALILALLASVLAIRLGTTLYQ